MYKLLAIGLAGVVGAGIWRRHELRSDADRASKAMLHAASTARSRLPRATVDDGDDDDRMVETGPADTAGSGDDAAVVSAESDDLAVAADTATTSA